MEQAENLKKKVIIIGGGYSVKEGLAKDLWNKIINKEIWSLNFCYEFMPYVPKRQIWMDRNVFIDKCKEIQIMYHKGVDLYTQFNALYKSFSEDIVINQLTTFRDKKDFDSLFPEKLFVGRFGFVGILSLSLAIKENYDEIYLLGYDFGTTSINDSNTHWYQELVKEKGIKSKGVGNAKVYIEHNNIVKSSVGDFDCFEKYKDKIYNVSLKSNIGCFNKISYDEFFNKIEE